MKNFFLVFGASNTWQGVQVQTLGTPYAPLCGPLLVRTRPFLCWISCLVAPKLRLTEVVRSKPERPAYGGKYPLFLGPIRVPYPKELNGLFSPLQNRCFVQ